MIECCNSRDYCNRDLKPSFPSKYIGSDAYGHLIGGTNVWKSYTPLICVHHRSIYQYTYITCVIIMIKDIWYFDGVISAIGLLETKGTFEHFNWEIKFIQWIFICMLIVPIDCYSACKKIIARGKLYDFLLIQKLINCFDSSSMRSNIVWNVAL